MRNLILFLSLTCLSCHAMANTLKVGTVDIQKVSPVMRTLFASSEQSTFGKEQKEMKALQTSLRTLREKLKAKGNLDQEKQKALQTSLSGVQNKLREKRGELMKKMRTVRGEQQKKFRQKWDSLIAQVAKEKQVDLIVPNNVVLFATDKVDLTEEIIHKLRK